MSGIQPLEWNNGKLRFLDQTKLPLEEHICETDDVIVVAEAIKRLAIRGAPLIGIAAAYGVVLASRSEHASEKENSKRYLHDIIKLLAETRPTAVNLFWALDRQHRILDAWKSDSLTELQNKLLEEAQRIHHEDAGLCERISDFGAQLFLGSSSILTHCNAGALATGGRGTAVGIITKLWELNKLKHVFLTETRPLLQGARLTAWEMKQAKIPATIIVDSVAAVLMKKSMINAVIIGADRIAMNGDAANKIGSYALSVLAKEHGIPFYVAAPYSTIDPSLKSGDEIPIEERNAKEVVEISGKRIVPEGISVYSPAFDVVPQNNITAIISDHGIHRTPFNESLKDFQSY